MIKKGYAEFLEKFDVGSKRDAIYELGREASSFIRQTMARPSPIPQLLVVLGPPYRTATDADGIVHKSAQEEDPPNEAQTRRYMCSFDRAVDDQERRTVTCIQCLTIAT